MVKIISFSEQIIEKAIEILQNLGDRLGEGDILLQETLEGSYFLEDEFDNGCCYLVDFQEGQTTPSFLITVYLKDIETGEEIRSLVSEMYVPFDFDIYTFLMLFANASY